MYEIRDLEVDKSTFAPEASFISVPALIIGSTIGKELKGQSGLMKLQELSIVDTCNQIDAYIDQQRSSLVQRALAEERVIANTDYHILTKHIREQTDGNLPPDTELALEDCFVNDVKRAARVHVEQLFLLEFFTKYAHLVRQVQPVIVETERQIEQQQKNGSSEDFIEYLDGLRNNNALKIPFDDVEFLYILMLIPHETAGVLTYIMMNRSVIDLLDSLEQGLSNQSPSAKYCQLKRQQLQQTMLLGSRCIKALKQCGVSDERIAALKAEYSKQAIDEQIVALKNLDSDDKSASKFEAELSRYILATYKDEPTNMFGRIQKTEVEADIHGWQTRDACDHFGHVVMEIFRP